MKTSILVLGLALVSVTWAQAQNYDINSQAYQSDGKPGSGRTRNQAGEVKPVPPTKGAGVLGQDGQTGKEAGKKSGVEKKEAVSSNQTTVKSTKTVKKKAGYKVKKQPYHHKHVRRNRIISDAHNPEYSQAQQAPATGDEE